MTYRLRHHFYSSRYGHYDCLTGTLPETVAAARRAIQNTRAKNQ
jgi:hypothetical protein